MIFWENTWAIRGCVGMWKGKKWAYLESLLTTKKITKYLLDNYKSSMKSMDIDVQGFQV